MTFKLEITAVETTGDAIRVTAQGKSSREADWQAYKQFKMELPVHVAKYYHVGHTIKVIVKP